jgi:hypothetical protein
LPVTAWDDNTIQVAVPAGTPAGASQLTITADNGRSTINGLTFHVLGAGYSPTVREVGEGKQYATIQDALDAAFTANADDLVVVYPGSPDLLNPRNNPMGAYYENLIMASPVKLQGVGPGGFQGSFFVPGSIIDAGAFGGDTQLAADWFTKIGGLTWDGNQSVNDGAGVYVIASENATAAAGQARQFTSGYRATIDGFDIRGGDQQGFPGNINDLTGAPTGLPPNITTQGGAIFANAYARYLQITNNVVENNGGGYGTIRLGTPDLPAPETNQHNENARISHNRIVNNGGTNLAGAIGLFAGSHNYEVDHNDICGNYSVEYGGGMTAYGRSPGGRIHHNRIYLNMSFDEGGGIMIAGQLPSNPDDLSPGSGPVDIYANEIKANLANDDGGGVRFLMAGGPGGTDQMNVVNNVVADNVSTHEGAGISLNDAPNVRVVNNTVMKNLTTATAATSNGQPAPAGLSTSGNSDQLQATLPGGAPSFSDPVLFNNIFWDNRAGTRAGTTITGIGLAGDATPVDNWDVGMFDTPGLLSPTNSVIQQDAGQHAYNVDGSNSGAAPQVVDAYDVSVHLATWRQQPAFVDATLVAIDAPPDQLGDYHLANCPASPACNLGAANKGAVNAPATDLDDQQRPALGGYDAGADEFGATLPTPVDLYFSTMGSTNPPGVAGTADDADVYRFLGGSFTRAWDATGAGVPGTANVDGFSRVDAGHFYLSFTADGLTLPNAGGGSLTGVNNEDVVYYDNGTWRMFFDGSTNGLPTATNVVAFSVKGQTLYFSLSTTALPPGSGTPAGLGDVYRWNGGSSFTRVVDASSVTGMPTAAPDGLIVDTASHFWVSYPGDTTIPGPGAVQDEDVVEYNAPTWTTWFDGTGAGLTTASLDVDAISQPTGADPMPSTPPPADPLFFSTAGNLNPPGAGGTADDADLYGWNGTAHSRIFDATSAGLPTGADVDGLDRVDNTHFYLSFTADTTLPGIGAVQDEDVVFYDAGVWSVYFNGTANGLTDPGEDIDALNIVGGTLYFSTLAGVNPPGVGGTADDADVYSRSGTSYARVFDASANGIPLYANVDGLVWTDATHLYVSFSNTATTLPGLGTVQDEDVVRKNGVPWSVYFNGTAHGLGTADGLDVDAFDLP